jgi:hypothetical protein
MDCQIAKASHISMPDSGRSLPSAPGRLRASEQNLKIARICGIPGAALFVAGVACEFWFWIRVAKEAKRHETSGL